MIINSELTAQCLLCTDTILSTCTESLQSSQQRPETLFLTFCTDEDTEANVVGNLLKASEWWGWDLK